MNEIKEDLEANIQWRQARINFLKKEIEGHEIAIQRREEEIEEIEKQNPSEMFDRLRYRITDEERFTNAEIHDYLNSIMKRVGSGSALVNETWAYPTSNMFIIKCNNRIYTIINDETLSSGSVVWSVFYWY